MFPFVIGWLIKWMCFHKNVRQQRQLVRKTIEEKRGTRNKTPNFPKVLVISCYLCYSFFYFRQSRRSSVRQLFIICIKSELKDWNIPCLHTHTREQGTKSIKSSSGKLVLTNSHQPKHCVESQGLKFHTCQYKLEFAQLCSCLMHLEWTCHFMS